MEHCESVTIDHCHLVDVNDEVEVSLIPDQIGQHVVDASTARDRKLSMHRDDDVLRGPTNGDTQTSGCTRRSRAIGDRASGQHDPSLVVPLRFVDPKDGWVGSPHNGPGSGGLDVAGFGIVVTAPAATSSCQSTKNWKVSGDRRSSTLPVTVM